MTEKVASDTRTAVAKKSSRNPRAAQCPISGIAKSLLNSAPYASRIVATSTMNAQNVKKWAAPGIDHFSSLRCPNTSSSWSLAR